MATHQLTLGLGFRWIPALVLLAPHLPDVLGDDRLRRLREAPETQSIPIVTVSADATARELEPPSAAGTVAYLTKPLHSAEFLLVLDEILERTTSASDASATPSLEAAIHLRDVARVASSLAQFRHGQGQVRQACVESVELYSLF